MVQSQPDPGPRKARLFCPDCGREGSLPGEWTVRTAGDRVRTECPECGAVVDERPRDRTTPEPSGDGSGGERAGDRSTPKSSGDPTRAAGSVVGPAYSAATVGCRWVLSTQARLLDRWSDRVQRRASAGGTD